MCILIRQNRDDGACAVQFFRKNDLFAFPQNVRVGLPILHVEVQRQFAAGIEHLAAQRYRSRRLVLGDSETFGHVVTFTGFDA